MVVMHGKRVVELQRKIEIQMRTSPYFQIEITNGPPPLVASSDFR